MQGKGGDISVLPEECISSIFSLTSPKDACISSLVSRMFKSAADSDAVWEKFLPADHKDIVARSSAPLLDLNQFGSKKGLYFSLCDEPLLIDGGKKSFSLEKTSGKKCFMIGARELIIHWGEAPYYWKWIAPHDSRFAEDAELLAVCWLFISGTVDTAMLSPNTTYSVYLIIRFTDDIDGLDRVPQKASVSFVEGVGNASGTRLVRLNPQLNHVTGHLPYMISPYGVFDFPEEYEGVEIRHFPRERGDGWMELEMGEFYNEDGRDGRVEVCLNATEDPCGKTGLIVQGIEVRPKNS